MQYATNTIVTCVNDKLMASRSADDNAGLRCRLRRVMAPNQDTLWQKCKVYMS